MVVTFFHYAEIAGDRRFSIIFSLVSSHPPAPHPVGTTTTLRPPPAPTGCADPASRPNIPLEGDCSFFYHCGADGTKVLKECGPGTLFDPNSMICGWPDVVLKVRLGDKK